jgi:hypothetical protein
VSSDVVYVVVMEEGSGWVVWGIYDTKEKAEAAAEKAPNRYPVYVEERALNKENPFG